MARSIQARHVDTAAQLIVAKPHFETFYSGGWDPKQLLTGRVGRTAVSYVVRSFRSPFLLNGYVEAWRTLREGGQPVVPDLYEAEGLQLLATDIKAKGGELYGKNLLRCLRGLVFEPTDYFRRREEMDGAFLDLTSSLKFPRLREEVMGYVETATGRDVQIPTDDPYELFVTPEGRSGIVSLDIHDAGPREDSAHTARANELAGVEFLKNIQSVRKLLLEK